MTSRLPPHWSADAVAAHRLHALIVRTLVKAVSSLEREQSIHRNLCGVSASGTGEPGIAQALHKLTGLPAVIEDRYGNLHAWAGPGQPDPYPKPRPEQRQEFLRQLTRRGSVVCVKDRLVALARARDDTMLGVLALVDTGRTGGRTRCWPSNTLPWCSAASSRTSMTWPS